MPKTKKDFLEIFHSEDPQKLSDLFAESSSFTDRERRIFYSAIEQFCLENEGIDAKIDKYKNTFLHYAAQHDDEETIRFLIAKGSSLNKINKNLETPLIIAAKYNSSKALRILLEQEGVILDLPDIMGCTALHHAAQNGNSIRALIARKANLESADIDGQTILMAVAASGSVESLEEVIKSKKVDITAADKGNCDALFYALANGKIETARLLIKKGLRPDKPNHEGTTALQIFAMVIASQESEEEKEKMKKFFGEMLAIIKQDEMSGEYPKRKVAKSKSPEEETNFYIDLYVAKSMLQLSYSDNGFGTPRSVNLAKIICDYVPLSEIKLEEKKAEDLSEILHKISAKEEFEKDGMRIKIIESSMRDHVSYYMIFYDPKTRTPLHLIYVDGDNSFEKNPLSFVSKKSDQLRKEDRKLGKAATKFAVNSDIYPSVEDLERHLLSIKESDQLTVKTEIGLAVTGEENISDLRPESFIETKLQERWNCGFKSLTILARTLMHELHFRSDSQASQRESTRGMMKKRKLGGETETTKIHKDFKEQVVLSFSAIASRLSSLRDYPKIAQEAEDILRATSQHAQKKLTSAEIEDKAIETASKIEDICQSSSVGKASVSQMKGTITKYRALPHS